MGMKIFDFYCQYNAVEAERIYKFVVQADNIPSDQFLCVTGDCEPLGNWNPQLVYKLACKNMDNRISIWSGEVSMPLNRDIKYRYCTCSFLPVIEGEKRMLKTSVHHIENAVTPRIIKSDSDSNVSKTLDEDIKMDTYGVIDGNYNIELGSLTSEFAIQLILTNNAIQWQSSYLKKKEVFVKLLPIILENELTDYVLSPNYGILTSKTEILTTSVLVSIFGDGDNRYKPQEEYGFDLSSGGAIAFLIRTFLPNLTAIVFNFYVKNDDGGIEENMKLIGYGSCLLRKQSNGELTIPVNTADHKYLGQITVQYLLVRPLTEHKCDLKAPYSKFWKDTWKGLEIGHRGAGVSFSDYTNINADVRENTIGSLRKASDHGADMVEFDVQLSKDLIPAIYHDFHVLIPIPNKISDQSSKMKLPLQEFSSDELRSLKIHHLKEKNTTKSFSHDGLEGYEPFPTLQKAFREINSYVGFNVEIKYSLQKKDGFNELDYPIDMNQYVDTILEVVFHNAGSRYVVFSSFHPDICTMVRLKQNRYPILFLTQGVTKKYVGYQDFRTESISMAVCFAISSDILGINVHAEDLLRDPEQIDFILNNNLILFCWGDDNNNEEVIQSFKEKGVHGIIFDRIQKMH